MDFLLVIFMAHIDFGQLRQKTILEMGNFEYIYVLGKNSKNTKLAGVCKQVWVQIRYVIISKFTYLFYFL